MAADNESKSGTVKISSVPEPGQLVEVRRRNWIVGDVSTSVFDSGMGQSTQHLVNLASMDEDSVGEELDVVWEIEPGARVMERAGLPHMTDFDDPERLDAFLDAVRWGGVTNADRGFLQAPFRSGVAIEDYQLDPLVRAIDMARVNLLIADDVGLGKTIEAGLVIQELLIRHRARTVLVLCPASLMLKWQAEMIEKFGLEFRIVDTEYLHTLRRSRGIHANPWTSFPRLITSMDWAKSGEALRLFKDILPPHVTYPRKFDILVVDEAHNVSPTVASQYAMESQRTRLVRVIGSHFEHRLFLSATPHNGYQESFTALLELLDDQRFARSVMPDENQKRRVMIRRLKADIVDADGKRVFPVRKLEALEVDYTKEEKEIHALLRSYSENRLKSVADTKYSFGADFVHTLLKKRLFSSPEAFSTTLEKHKESVVSAKGRKERSAENRILRRAILKASEEYADETLSEEAEHEAVQTAGDFGVELTSEQRQMLDRMTAWAASARGKADSKATAIVDWLAEHLKPQGSWNDRRVILFTEYRATQSWLQRILVSKGYGGDRLSLLHGGLNRKEREKIKAAFQANPDVSKVRILLATDAASEGIDLQNHCNYLIHVEIPWNPNVMEQRNGRIDRHGQKYDEIFIWHPVGKGFKAGDETKDIEVGKLEGDHEYLMRAVLKLETMREDLGSVGPVIARQVEEAMLGRTKRLDTKAVEEKAVKARKLVSAERKLKERVAKIHERVLEAKQEFHLSPDRIERAVRIALQLAGLPGLKPVFFPDAPRGTVFEVPPLPGSWGSAAVGLEHPHTHVRRPVTFDHDVAKGRDDVVLVHMNHRLVQMCLRLLRAEIWALEDLKKLHRVSVRTSDDPDLRYPTLVVWSRLVVTGGGHHRLHEELTLSGGEFKEKGLSRVDRLGRFEELLENSYPVKPEKSVFDKLGKLYRRDEETLRTAIEARSKDRLKHLESTLERRKQSEVSDLAGVLDELERSIKKELETPPPDQLELWPSDQRDQLRRDVEALRARLARIPSERENEKKAIEKRYEGIQARTFPVAVVFVVPRSFLGAGGKS